MAMPPLALVAGHSKHARPEAAGDRSTKLGHLLPLQIITPRAASVDAGAVGSGN